MPSYSVTLRYNDDNGRFVAIVPELPGCVADGPTRETAVAAATTAAAEWIAEARERGEEIPPGSPAPASRHHVTLPD